MYTCIGLPRNFGGFSTRFLKRSKNRNGLMDSGTEVEGRPGEVAIIQLVLA